MDAGSPPLDFTEVGSRCPLVGYDGGAGSFEVGSVMAVGTHVEALAAADVNGDGRTDLVVVDQAWPGTLNVLLNRGARRFDPPLKRPDDMNGNFPGPLALGDVDGDGLADAIVGNWVGGNISVFRNLGGSPGAIDHYPATGNARGVAVADVDGDQRLDIVVADDSGIGTFVHRGAAALFRDKTMPSGYLACLVAADFDGDGRPDLAGCRFPSDEIVVWHNAGGGAFDRPLTLPAGGPWRAATGNVQGGRFQDLLVIDLRAPRFYRSQRPFGFDTPVIIPSIPLFDPQSAVIGDLDGDGSGDVLFAAVHRLFLAVSREGGRAFDPPLELPGPSYEGGYGGTGVVIADLDGDGDNDIAELVAFGGPPGVRVLWNRCR